MKPVLTILSIISLLLGIISCSELKQQQMNLTQYVDPFIGTAYVGHTHPAAQLPFGMVQVGPDTGTDTWEHCSGYYDKDSSIIGFSHTHLSGTGCPDMGDILFMPVVGEVVFNQGDEADTSTGYRSAFTHATEDASPGYYKVFLDDYHIQAELTATDRAGFHKYCFPQSDLSGIMIDLGHGIGDTPLETEITVLNDSTIVGKRRSQGFVEDHTYYFYAVLSKPITKIFSFSDGILSNEKQIKGKDTKIRVCFETKKNETVTAKVALSTTGIEEAGKNLEKEVGRQSFEEIRDKANTRWNDSLCKIELDPLYEDQRMAFYTALYHTLVMPNKITDVDGTYALPNGTRINNGSDRYTNFSLWDTYRTTHPFYVLMYPEENLKFVESMVDLYKQRGVLCTNEYGQNETWCMIGNHAVPVLADVYLKGMVPEKEKKTIAEAIFRSLTVSHPKSDWEIYDKYGYYPFDLLDVESVSRTMEHGYDDYCASLVAKGEQDSDKQQFFSQRANNFKNLFDPSTKLMRGKDSKGKWREPFDSFLLSHAGTSGGDYTEGNAWQYTWHIQLDIPGLVELMGGKSSFESKLDSLFFLDIRSLGGGFHGDVTGMIGQYAHGNEPSHHIAYLYNYTDNTYKTQEIIRRIFDQFYLPTRDGLSGNDDCGQMSAWYIFSALGFYPVDPVSGEYIIGAPQVKGMRLHLPNGKTFEMKAHHISKENKYVKSILLNGIPLESFKITYDEILKGGLLEFEMTKSKNIQESSPFGVCAHLQSGSEHNQIPENLQMMYDAGIRWARVDFSWSGIEPTQGNWNFSHIDRVVEEAGKTGLNISALLLYHVAWANPAYKHLDLWLQYVEKTVTRYKDKVRYWEVWNEPNLFWENPNGADYTILLEATYKKIKEVDPGLTVLYGGTSGIPMKFLEESFKSGAGAFCDIVNIHPYRGRLNTMDKWSQYQEDLANLQNLMYQYGIGNKKIWITEMGWSTWTTLNATTKKTFELEREKMDKSAKKGRFAVLFDRTYQTDPNLSIDKIQSWFSDNDEIDYIHVSDLKQVDLSKYKALFVPPWEEFAAGWIFDALIPPVFRYMHKGGNIYFYGDGAITEDEQASYLSQSILLSLRLGIERFFWYEFQSPEDSPFDREAHFGLVSRQLEPKPAYFAQRTLTGLFSEGSVVDTALPWNRNDFCQIKWKQEDGTYVWAVWRPAGNQEVGIKIGHGFQYVLDQSGNKLPITQQTRTLLIGQETIYIVGPQNIAFK